MQSKPDFRAFQRRLLIAIGALPVLTACGGKVVFVEDDDGAGGRDGGGGAPTIPTTGGAGGDIAMGGASGFCPGHETSPYVCMQTFEGCPPASSEEAYQLVRSKLEEDQSCTVDPQFCWCSANISDIPCGPDPSALQCCYVVEYTVEEQCEGRPFIVGESVRVAPLEARPDWSLVVAAPAVAGLSATQRSAIAAVWQRRAQFEHASVASFARFTLELLSLGAPAELVAAATRAASDEVEHARICFGVAAAFADEPIGPGPLSVTGALDGRRTLAEIASAAVIEGCIGETCAALEALATHAEACDALTALTARIAADEQTHAELAWRFVAWAYASGDASVRAAIKAAFETAPSFEVEASDVEAPTSFGVRSPEQQRLTRGRAWREVIAPARDRLLSLAGRTERRAAMSSPGYAFER